MLLTAATALPLSLPAMETKAQEAGTTIGERSEWQVEKCAVFAAALDRILKRMGEEGVTPAFIANNRAYIDSGCLSDVDACPETAKDIEIANGLTIATMNAGAASSFSPFRCRPKG
ncbi:hypothetical protein [Rhizobium sp. AAP43]|uniref:hypothetical protein n=1 Tax=Rhizobium sp. AAP43 TaxID=1523420 RepID=UPI0006B9FCFB|nr:hypothetical protein [Rhizobium sp. AAP43]KPF46905.1 hypothetical protein IP76_03300 [Rhizobium sp. AAP43]